MVPLPPGVKIVTRSPLAFCAKFVLRTRAVAMVVGRTIHVSGASREAFSSSDGWVRHELVHVEQFERYGFLRFLALYLLESARRGYVNNRFEVEARERSGFG
ncbi:DUF4157 domain-containing protein [Deinococcus yavapaiensis]|uniref:DUF4157 domain-containing protein n=1 Tax=Deinococcus yavapaiensis KR-236 TaxID=694435 RepID=A0A318S436_9DEIO|nr:DUF4157 domain-containing protein [Deinococcus yavapaiensis]PYE53305.1 hypothetical protein DES52_10978 [Deinococcus yavapaiensis KR-236]